LSRLFGRILVCNYIATKIPLEVLNNQFAFRATGSTTAALIAINHSIATTLEENQYARAVLFDFSKAFDRVDHDVLFNKLSRLPLPTKIFRLIISFLSERKQYTLINGNQSLPAPINMGIIQGSVLGPTLFTILVNDIRPLNKINHLIKYADDLTLIYSPKSPISIEDEVNNIINWSLTNKLAINYKKTKEIIFTRPRFTEINGIATIPNIERVFSTKLLGISMTSDFRFNQHLQNTLAQCNKTMYLLYRLKSYGLTTDKFQILFRALVLSKLF
jgi:hypothetical protein